MKKIFVFQGVIIVITLGILGAVMYTKTKPANPPFEVATSSAPLVMASVDQGDRERFVNPAVITDLGKHYIINFKPLRDEIVGIQTRYKNKSYVYFLYLNNGAWVGMNEKELFTAASTLKVPLAMSLLKAVGEKKISLASAYSLDKLNLDSNFGDLYKVGADKEFTVEELLKIMLEQSDNTAMNGLFEVFTLIGIDDPLGDVYSTLGWEFDQNIPEMGQAIDYSEINLKTLSNMFLALYNAKYLNIENSERILRYLSKSPFNDKIVSGVPKNVLVSHKIGTAATENTYSDCGIVYAPNRHYLLCLGSTGVDEKTAARFMSEVSRAVYQYVIND